MSAIHTDCHHHLEQERDLFSVLNTVDLLIRRLGRKDPSRSLRIRVQESMRTVGVIQLQDRKASAVQDAAAVMVMRWIW